MKPPTNAQFSVTVLNIICSNIEPVLLKMGIYICPKHLEIISTNITIVVSSWYLSLFSYMMHGHTYIKFFAPLLTFSLLS